MKHQASATETTSSGALATAAKNLGNTKRAPSAAKPASKPMPRKVSTIGASCGDSRLGCNARITIAQMS